MRKLIALLAALGVGQVAFAEGSTMSTSAEFRVRGEFDANTTGNKDAGKTTNDWAQRLKLGLNFNAGEKFSGHATLLHNAMWGQNLITTDGTSFHSATDGDSAPAVHDGTTTAQNALMVNEAYGTWMISDSTSFRVGRGAFELADGSVVAINDWDATPNTFEGALLTHDMEFGRISGFYVKNVDWQGDGFVNDPEVNSIGVALDVKAVPDVIKMLSFHVMKIKVDAHDAAINTPAQNIMRLGLTVGGAVSGFDFRADYNRASGENSTELAAGEGNTQDIASSMMEVELGFTLPDVMNLRIYVDHHGDTGTSASSTKSETYDGYYYDHHRYGGQMEIFKWGNLTYNNVGVSLMPMDDITVGFDYYMFSQTEKDGGIMTGARGGGFGTGDATKDALGNEMDLWAKKKYDNGFSIVARYSQFAPGDEYKAGGLKDAYTQMFLQGQMNF